MSYVIVLLAGVSIGIFLAALTQVAGRSAVERECPRCLRRWCDCTCANPEVAR